MYIRVCTYCKYKTVSYIHIICICKYICLLCLFLISLFIPILCIYDYIIYNVRASRDQLELVLFQWHPALAIEGKKLRKELTLCCVFQPMPCQGTVPTKKNSGEHLHIGNIWLFYKIDWKNWLNQVLQVCLYILEKEKTDFFSRKCLFQTQLSSHYLRSHKSIIRV